MEDIWILLILCCIALFLILVVRHLIFGGSSATVNDQHGPGAEVIVEEQPGGDIERDTGFNEPEGNAMEVDVEVQILCQEAEAETRKKRAAAVEPDNYDEDNVQPSIDGGEDDTAIVEAASCQEFEKECKDAETGDLFACGADKGNCSDNVNGIEDTEINDNINCAYAGKNGKQNGKCQELASE